MDKDKNQTIKRDDEIAIPSHEGMQETSDSTERPNIDVIVARNEKNARQDRMLMYKTAGMAALLLAVIIFAIYFFI